MKRTRLIAWSLLLALLLPILAAPSAFAAGTSKYNGKSYSTDYSTWRQADDAWGETPLGDLHTMTRSGCLITSIAALMCHSGAYDPAVLNPGTLRDWLDAKGYISHSEENSRDALLSYGPITSTVSPRFYYVGQTTFPVDTSMEDVCKKIQEYQAKGYYLVARVRNSGHFVAVDKTTGEDDAAIFDPGYAAKKELSFYEGTIGGLLFFKANLSGKDTILPGNAAPPAPKPNDLNDTYGDADKITVTWASVSQATHYNIYVDKKNSDGTWTQDYKYYFYVKSPHSIDALPAGTYRLKLQSANSNTTPWTSANAPYQTFTVKSGQLTLTFDPAGGKVSKTSQMVSSSGKYDLPTPTKSKSAFLGWFTEDGQLATNGASYLSKNGHTLKARWDSGGVGFQKTATYHNNFNDVASNAWYRDSVAGAYSYGLMNGIEAKKFKPSGKITAAQTIVIAARLRKLYLTGSGSFSTTDPWYKAYSDYAVSQKIISSAPKDMNAELTRQEFASILASALPDAALPEVNKVPDGSIPDVYRSDTAIYKLYRAGIFVGNDATGIFRPNADISRAEVAAVVLRMVDPNSRMRITLK